MLVVTELVVRATKCIITVRNQVAKVMFLQVSVCPQGESAPGDGGCLVWGGSLLPGVCAWSGGVCSGGRGNLVWGVPDPGGVGIPACTEADPRERRLLLRTIRILLECILVEETYLPLQMPFTIRRSK